MNKINDTILDNKIYKYIEITDNKKRSRKKSFKYYLIDTSKKEFPVFFDPFTFALLKDQNVIDELGQVYSFGWYDGSKDILTENNLVNEYKINKKLVVPEECSEYNSGIDVIILKN